MTNKEMLMTLIHIERNIYSKPIKMFIKDRIKTLRSESQNSAGSYHIKYQIPLYELKNPVKIDMEI